MKQDPEYKEAMQQFRKKVKHPISAEDFALRQEQNRVRECEKLVKKMNKALNDQNYFIPARVSKHHEFEVTTRIHSHGPIARKQKGKKGRHRNIESRTSADLKNDAFKAMSMIESLRQREKEIAIEEQEFLQSKL